MSLWTRRSAPPRREARVVVDGRYLPEVVDLAADVSTRIVFNRRDSSACTDQVVFPAFGICAELPRDRDVVIELPPAKPGEYGFECGMGMVRGRLIVH